MSKFDWLRPGVSKIEWVRAPSPDDELAAMADEILCALEGGLDRFCRALRKLSWPPGADAAEALEWSLWVLSEPARIVYDFHIPPGLQVEVYDCRRGITWYRRGFCEAVGSAKDFRRLRQSSTRGWT